MLLLVLPALADERHPASCCSAAGISVGSIFGVYEPSPECRIEDMDDPEAMMQK